MKKLHIAVLISSVVVLSGCLNKSQTASVTMNDGQTSVESLSEWQKIADAIESGKSVVCDMTNTQTKQTGKYYVKGEKMRFDSINQNNPEESGSFLTDSEFIYTWNDAKKEGIKFAVVEPTQEQPDAPETAGVPDFSQESAWDEYNDLGYTVTCTTESFDESLLTPPTDIVFTDMSTLMQNAQNSANSGNSGAPAMTQEQVEEMVRQYQ